MNESGITGEAATASKSGETAQELLRRTKQITGSATSRQCLASLVPCEDGEVIFRFLLVVARATFRVGRGRETMRAVKLEKRDGPWLIVERTINGSSTDNARRR